MDKVLVIPLFVLDNTQHRLTLDNQLVPSLPQQHKDKTEVFILHSNAATKEVVQFHHTDGGIAKRALCLLPFKVWRE